MRVGPSFAVGFAACLVLPLSAQDTGQLVGLVVDDRSGRVIEGVTVALPELDEVETTGEDGRFRLEGLPGWVRTVRFHAPGYVSLTEVLDLSVLEFLQVRLVPMTAALDEILVIAGASARRARRVEVRADEPSSTSALELLEDHVPGLVVARGGGNVGGGGAAVMIRGISTFQGSTAPDVYLDGVRLDGGDTGEYAMHVLDQILASEVARIRVLKGAANSSPYASSANGVILIETHRGSRGPDGA